MPSHEDVTWTGAGQAQDGIDEYMFPNDWDLDNIRDDWSILNEPPWEPYSPSTSFASPRRSQNTEGSSERQMRTSPRRHLHTHDAPLALTSPTPPMGNTASTSSNLPNAQQPEPTTTRQILPSTTSRRRPLVAGHSEDRLNLSNGGPSSFDHSGHFFDPISASPEPQRASYLPADHHTENDMPPVTRRQRSSFVDLTTGPSSPAQPPPTWDHPRSLKRSVQDAEKDRSAKRSKATSHQIDELDLTEEAPSAEEELQRAEQEKAIAAQQAEQESSGPQKIGQRQCIICMENYTNATVTLCGHIYCHECLTQALIAGEKNNDRGVGNCPVCRKPVSRKKANQITPLAFMKKSSFRGKAKNNMGLLG